MRVKTCVKICITMCVMMCQICITPWFNICAKCMQACVPQMCVIVCVTSCIKIAVTMLVKRWVEYLNWRLLILKSLKSGLGTIRIGFLDPPPIQTRRVSTRRFFKNEATFTKSLTLKPHFQGLERCLAGYSYV